MANEIADELFEDKQEEFTIYKLGSQNKYVISFRSDLTNKQSVQQGRREQRRRWYFGTFHYSSPAEYEKVTALIEQFVARLNDGEDVIPGSIDEALDAALRQH